MKVDDLLKGKTEWLKQEGPDSDIAISTRVRIARNVEGHIYINRADDVQREETLSTLTAALKKSRYLKGAMFLKLRDTTNLDKRFMVERHLMSRQHMTDTAHKGLVVEENEILSIMLNEEDHVRLQVLKSGFDVMEAWRIVDEIDTDLGQYVAFDYSNKFGYLTACPTNTGTGLRASVMLHLSALAMTGQIENVHDVISKLGLTIRGFYGEGTDALGDFFQISNQVALGHSEMDILDNLERIIRKIVASEKKTREKLIKQKKSEIADGIARSYGTLKSARIITSSETVKLLSAVRLGIDLGLINDVDMKKINEVLLLTQPAHLQKINKKELSPYERDIKRADLIREKLGNSEKG